VNEKERRELLGAVAEAVAVIEGCREFAALIPEVRTNIVYAARDAQGPEDVAAVDGRITVVNGMPRAAGRPRLGASSHMARAIVEARKLGATERAGINFANDPHLAEWLREYCRSKDWVFGHIDRGQEPAEMQREDVPSMPWKVRTMMSSTGGRLPKVGYETGAVGKEPVSALFGDDAVIVAQEMCEIARQYKRPRRSW